MKNLIENNIAAQSVLRLTQINMNCDGIATFFKSFVEAPMSSLDRQILA